MTKEVTGGNVVIKWEPTLDGACPVVQYRIDYKEVALQAGKKASGWNTVTVNRNTTSYTLHLMCGREYKIVVTSLPSQRESGFRESGKWQFKTKGGNRTFMRLNFEGILKQF